ncbi:adenosylmethionine--8-amino-7-oxononanoate transaminase [Thermanaerosceptrum fracticalcis]|uniref:Adenosylmethionine-8-amino-7-oxononanoate aminotransferase n=1 Tax=Thermanaerosceptrum fracticalcis TaxID=1712410 RepID=A0A7G6E0K1_THEFR|nr:adenosylmethionine--8-amino-7-oxononanoate transaminase [Thermanaerosceptrum fracticalcis]QNB45605.1 adenosylmethionine--8-amino-7-oxononanoate transaminase [Thermanaerosceptrum fracticalcis]
MNHWQQKDLQYVWHPCSQMKDYEDFPPIVIERGEGPYLYDMEGKAYLDAVSSWWVNLFGHSNKRINEAIRRQCEELEHVIFANFSHKPAIQLAEKIVEITPPGLQKVFFADNGSSAVEVALKLSYQYHQQAGHGAKTKFVAISDAYHGETLGALAVGDLDLYSRVFEKLTMRTYKAQGPDCFRCAYGQRREDCSAQCFENLEKLVEEKHQEICGVIIEPLIQGAAGMKIYPPVYLRRLRELCSEYNIHLIADEIAVGFGRTGKMFACEHAGISPDLMCLSKGLTAGYLPLALTLVTEEIYQAFYADYRELKAFMHSHSYTGNPIACAVANESLNIFQEENILEKNRHKSRLIALLSREKAENHPYIGEFRQLGMVGALELVEDKRLKKGFDWKERVGYQIYRIALGKGVLLRPLGNVIYFMPPYVVDEKDIEFMVNTAFAAINRYFGIE